MAVTIKEDSLKQKEEKQDQEKPNQYSPKLSKLECGIYGTGYTCEPTWVSCPR